MLLQELRTYTERMDMPPALYVEAPVRYIIDLDIDGNLNGVIDTAESGSGKTRRGMRRLVPQVQRAAGIKPLLLADKADYVFDYVGEGDKPARVQQCHAAFMALLSDCERSTQEPVVSAIRRFLEGAATAQVTELPAFDASGISTFRIGDVFPVDLASVQAFWAAVNDPAAKDAPVMQCVVCGERRPVLVRLQAKVKGVPGGQTAGTSIISANAPAFESYGLEESFIAPTCSDCGERFTKALNQLLSSEDQCLRVAGAAFVFWTREPESGFNVFAMLDQPDPAQVRDLLASVRSGGRTAEVDADRFFGCSLSGSGGRAVVRDWIDTTVGEAKQRLAEWFGRQEIVDPYGQPMAPIGVRSLGAATVRDLRDLPTPTPLALFRAALTGTPLPPSLLQAAVRRCQVEQRVTRLHAALIKLALSFSNTSSLQEASLVALDETSQDPGYRCGRLLAVLEQAQRLAIRGINQTVVDRFYGTAASAPRAVFPGLINGAKPHMAKLRRDRPGAAAALDRRLDAILIDLQTFPAVLTLEQQGLFALGYYHQRAKDRAEAQAAAERRPAGQAAPAEADMIEDDETKGN